MKNYDYVELTFVPDSRSVQSIYFLNPKLKIPSSSVAAQPGLCWTLS